MGDLLQPWHLILLAVILFLLFGVRRLPELGKGLGDGFRGFRDGIRGIFDPHPAATPAQQQNTAPAPTAQQNTASAPPASNAPAEPKQS